MKNIVKGLILSSIILIAACGGEKVESNMSSEVDAFTATTQEGTTITNEDLLGEWWVADFIFTNCTTVCPPMTRNMSILQKRLKETDSDDKVKLVSFSVDPENDTPEVLSNYADEHGADTNNWLFLTGYDFETIKDISINSFQSGLAEPIEGDDQVQHGIRFFLVNPEGIVFKNYLGTEAEQIDELASDIKKLVH